MHDSLAQNLSWVACVCITALQIRDNVVVLEARTREAVQVTKMARHFQALGPIVARVLQVIVEVLL